MGDVIVMDLLISSGKRQKKSCGCKNKIFVVMTDINQSYAKELLYLKTAQAIKPSFAFLCSLTGANVNAKDQGLLTPLHRAAASRNEVNYYCQMDFKKSVTVSS